MTGAAWSPVAPAALVALALLISAALVAWRIVRARRVRVGLVLIWLGVAGLAVILMNPVRERETASARRPRVVALVDGSASMKIRDAGDGRTRFEALRDTFLAPDALAEMADRADASAMVVREKPASIAWSEVGAVAPEADRTPLVAALNAAVDRAGAGGRVLALTDGAGTERPIDALGSVADLAVARCVRIDTVVVGSAEPVRDARLIARADPPIIFAGQRATIRAEVLSIGFDGASAVLSLRAGGDDGPVIDRRAIRLGVDREVAFTVTPAVVGADAGEYTITLSPIEGETDTANNVRRVVVDVIHDAVRVVVIEGRPSWDASFLVDALRADPLVDVTSVAALSASREVVRRYSPAAQTPADLARFDPSDLARFDVVVLGRAVERWFDAAGAVALERFVVAQGGAVVFLRGDPVEDHSEKTRRLREVVARLAPVRFGAGVEAGGRLGLTPTGRAATAFEGDPALGRAMRGLPAALATRRIEGMKPTAEVWLRAAPEFGSGGPAPISEDDSPALAEMNVGKGRALVVLADGMWRWAMAPGASAGTRGVYGAMWSRLVRWLAMGGAFTPGRALSVRAEPGPRRVGARVGLVVRTRARNKADRPSVTVADPAGDVAHLALIDPETVRGGWRTGFTPAREGVYTISAGALGAERPALRVAVYEDRRELLDPAAKPDSMRRLAAATGGRAWRLEERDAFLADLRAPAPAPHSHAEFEPVWDTPWLFAAIVALLGGGWIVQRREGAR